METLQKYKIPIPARFEVFDYEDGVWALRHNPEYIFETPVPKGKHLTKPRKKGLEKMLP